MALMILSPIQQNNTPIQQNQPNSIIQPLSLIPQSFWDGRTKFNKTTNGFAFIEQDGNYNGRIRIKFTIQQGISWSNVQMIANMNAGSNWSSLLNGQSGTPLVGIYGFGLQSGFFDLTIQITPPPDNIIPTLTLSSTIVYFNAAQYPNGISQSQQQAIINQYATVQDNVAGAFWELTGNYTTITSSTTQTVTYGVRARDVAGNVSAFQNFTIVLDAVPPFILGPSQVIYVIGSVTFIDQIITEHYSITDDVLLGPTNIIGSYNLNQVGNYFVDIRATDIAGNQTIKSIQISIIPPPDTTPPVINGPTSLTFEVGTYQLIEEILNTFYVISDDRGEWDWEILGSYNLLQSGTYSITLRAIDTAGNNTSIPITLNITAPVIIDTTPPTISGNSPVSRELGIVNNNSQLLALFIYSDNVTLPSAIQKELIGNVNYNQIGSYSVSIRATDTAGNQSTRNVVFNITALDTTPPVINGPLSVSIDINEYENLEDLINFYFTITDNTELAGYTTSGTVNFDIIGVYDVIITALDTRNNQSIRNLRITIREPFELGSYNPLTDLLSGIFGGLLSMIFTIGTINVLGFRVLDAIGIIVLGFVIWFVYKALKGGS